MAEKKRKKKKNVPTVIVRRTIDQSEDGKNLKAFFICDEKGDPIDSQRYDTEEEAKNAFVNLLEKQK